jgi:hypothetical protein
MHGLKSTIVLLVALAALVGYIYFVDSARTPGGADALPRAFTDISAENIVELQVRQANGDSARVERIDTSWQLTEPEQADADALQVASLTSSLANLDIQRVVDENPSDLGQYGLDPARIEVAFRMNGETEFRRLLIGEKTPTGSDLYAKTPDQSRVFLIASFLDATFNRTAFDFRDKSLVDFDSAAVTGLAISRGSETLRFSRSGSDWRIEAPIAGRADHAAVEGILTRMASAQMRQIVASEPANLGQYGLDRPSIVLTMSGGEAPATLLIGTSGDNGLYAKDAARPLVFTIEESLASDLRKAVTDFRRKDLFDSRSFTANRVEFRRGDLVQTFEKATADGKDVWQNADGANVDPTTIENLLTRLTSLQALSFEPGTHPTLNAPMLAVTVRFDTDRTETVSFGREGTSTDAYARRPDEQGTLQLSALPIEEVLEALDGLR